MAQCNKEIGLLKCTGRGKHRALSLEGQAGVGGRMDGEFCREERSSDTWPRA